MSLNNQEPVSVRARPDKKTDIGENQMVETQEIHCSGCGRFLGYQAIVWGHIKIKCHTCKQWNTLDIAPDN